MRQTTGRRTLEVQEQVLEEADLVVEGVPHERVLEPRVPRLLDIEASTFHHQEIDHEAE